MMRGRKIDWALVFLGVALLLGGYCRLWDLTGHSLFIDEGFTFMVAGKPWPQMISEIVYHDFHPPLFYILTHYALATLHWQFWDYRYLTAPFGLISIVAAWAIARRLFGDTAASIAALFIALEPSLIEWDRLYRMYSVMTALSALSWWLLLIAQEKEGRARVAFWILYALTAVASPYVQYLGAVNLLCQGLYALTNPRRLWPIFATGCAAVLALVPWLWALRIQYPNGGHVAGTSTLPINWLAIARDSLISGMPDVWARLPGIDWIVTGIVVAAAAFSIWRAPKTILPYWLAVAAVQAAASLATGKSLVVPRYMLHVVPAVAVALGGVIAWLLASKARTVGAVLAVGVPAFFATCTANVLWNPYYQFPDWYAVNLVVLQNERRDDAMLFVQGFPYVVVGDFTAFRGHDAAGPASPDDLPYTFHWLEKHKRQRVWYVENQWFYPDPNKKIKAYLDKTRGVAKLAGGRPAVWSEARASAGDIVNIILYSAAPATRNKQPAASRVSHVTSAQKRLERGALGH
jgi:4-amino-4-deoxy-L-arabinose transferase-like glycosyltransferase